MEENSLVNIINEGNIMVNVYEIIRNYFFFECIVCNNRNCVKFFG